MYHTLSKIVYSLSYGLTTGLSTYNFLLYWNIEDEIYWDRFFNKNILSLTIAAFTIGYYVGYNIDGEFKCVIPYQYLKK